MARTFTQFKVNCFPDAPSEKGAALISLGEEHLTGRTEQTRVVWKGSDPEAGIERYKVHHECLRHAEGRTYDGQEFDTFYQKNTFDAIYDRKAGRLVCAAPKRTAGSLIDALNERANDRFNFDSLKVDLAVLKTRLQNVRGVWVGKMTQPFVNTVACFGLDVQKSDFYQQAESNGEASSFFILYEYGELTYPTILTSTCGVTFLRDDPEPLCLDVLRHIQQNMLEGAVVVADSKFNARRKRAEAKASKPTAKGVVPERTSNQGLFETSR